MLRTSILMAGVAFAVAGLFTCLGLLEQIGSTGVQYRFLYLNGTKHFIFGLALIVIGQGLWLGVLLHRRRRRRHNGGGRDAANLARSSARHPLRLQTTADRWLRH